MNSVAHLLNNSRVINRYLMHTDNTITGNSLAVLRKNSSQNTRDLTMIFARIKEELIDWDLFE